MNSTKRPRTSYIRFFARNEETRSARTIIRTPLITMAVAMIQTSSVSAFAERIESNEKTRFIRTIIAMTLFAEAGSFASACSSSSAIMCMTSLVAV